MEMSKQELRLHLPNVNFTSSLFHILANVKCNTNRVLFYHPFLSDNEIFGKNKRLTS